MEQSTAVSLSDSKSLQASPQKCLSAYTILTLLAEIPVLYPQIKPDNSPESIRFATGVWEKYCGHLSDAEFTAAKDTYLSGPDGRFPIGPQMILAAHAKNEESLGRRPIDSATLDTIISQNRADANYAFAKAVALYFYGNNPCATPLNVVRREEQAVSIKHVCDALKLDLGDAPDGKDMLWRIIHFVVNDASVPGKKFAGWQQRMSSLLDLRKRDESGRLQHQIIWGFMPEHKKTAHFPMIDHE